MYSDLFDALGGGPNHHNASSSSRPENVPIVSFKAGKVNLTLQSSGKYWASPDTRRCQVNLKYNDENHLIWEWYDRREKTVVESVNVLEATKLERAVIPTNQSTKARDNSYDRVYYWKLDSEWKMIWLQSKEEETGLIEKVNDVLKHPRKPESHPPARTPTDSRGSGILASGTGRSPTNNSASSSSSTARQVDALSNILENLGMPQGELSNPATAGSEVADSTTGGTLTLADLQDVMTGLQEQSLASSPGLHELVTPETVTGLLENEAVRMRLLQELPEGQRSIEHLEENLRSPQVQQTLRSLTAALLPDENGSLDSYHSVLANFQLDDTAGQAALTNTNNPIQAFLDCVLASVQNSDGNESVNQEMKDD